VRALAYTDPVTNGATYWYKVRTANYRGQYGPYSSAVSSAGVNVTGTGGLTTTVNGNQPLIINPYFTTGDLTGWTSDHGTVAFQSGSNGPASGSTTYAIRTGSSGTPNEALRNTAKIPVYAGAVVKAQCAIRGIGTPNGTAGVRISWRDSTDTELPAPNGSTPGNTTTGNATNGTYVTGTAPAGAMFAHVECGFYNHTVGQYTVDNFAASSLADSMDQVPDGTTRFGATQNPSAQATTILQASAAYQPGDNLIPNPNGRMARQHWPVVFNGNALVPSLASAFGTWVWVGTPALTDQGLASDHVALGPAINLMLSVEINTHGITSGTVQFVMVYSNAAGAEITRDTITASNASAAFVKYTLPCTTPAGTASISWFMRASNLTGAANPFWRNLKCEAGTVATPFNDWASQDGNELTVPGSGQQLGNQLNNKPLVAAGLSTAYISSGGTLTQTYNSSDNTYSVTQAAFVLNVGGSTVSYNSWTSPHLAPATKYYFALNDPNWAGGSPSLVYSTSQTAMINNGYVMAGSYTTGASGGGGGGGGSGGGGSGCVAITSFLLPGVTAARARVGMRIDGAAGFKITGKTLITQVTFPTMPCVRLTAADGCALICSTTTPFTLPDGTTRLAPDMLGQAVLTDLSPNGSTVTAVEDAGSQPVAYITRQENESYAAGIEADKRIYSHNSIK